MAKYKSERTNDIHSQLHHGLTDKWPITLTNQVNTELNTINWCDTTHFASEDDYCTGCQNISDVSEQCYSRLHSTTQSLSNLLIKKKIIHKFLSSFSNVYLILTFSCSDSCTRMLPQPRTFSLTRKMLQDHRDLGVKDKVIMVQYQYCSKTILSAELIVSLEESSQFLN